MPPRRDPLPDDDHLRDGTTVVVRPEDQVDVVDDVAVGEVAQLPAAVASPVSGGVRQTLDIEVRIDAEFVRDIDPAPPLLPEGNDDLR
jgi:hypothetical protein